MNQTEKNDKSRVTWKRYSVKSSDRSVIGNFGKDSDVVFCMNDLLAQSITPKTNEDR